LQLLDLIVNVCMATLLINALNRKEVEIMSHIHSANCLKYWFAIWTAEQKSDCERVSFLLVERGSMICFTWGKRVAVMVSINNKT